MTTQPLPVSSTNCFNEQTVLFQTHTFVDLHIFNQYVPIAILFQGCGWVGFKKAFFHWYFGPPSLNPYGIGVTKLSTPKERYDSDRKLAHWPSRRADSKNCHTCSDYLLESSPDFRAGRKKIEVSVPFSWKPLFANLDMSVRFINFYFVWRAKFITKISTSGATISRHHSGDAIFRILSPYIYIYICTFT